MSNILTPPLLQRLERANGHWWNRHDLQASIPSKFVENESLSRALQEWTADARFQQARQARQDRQWQTRLSEEEARFSGLLIDLYERHCTVQITTENGRSSTGPITELGSDFVCIHANQGRQTFLRMQSITSIELEASPGRLGTPSLRVVDEYRTFEMVVAELAEENAAIRFATKNASGIRAGLLKSAGIDMVTVELTGPPTRTLFIAADQLTEISIAS